MNEAHAAPLLYVHPHPTAARRAATLASSEREMHMGARISLRPLQRRFKARKKPEGYTSTPTGLKRLKTAKYGVSRQRKRKGDAIRRPPTYTQAQTHSCKRRVRRFLFWWRRGESNPRPKTLPLELLRAQTVIYIPSPWRRPSNYRVW